MFRYSEDGRRKHHIWSNRPQSYNTLYSELLLIVRLQSLFFLRIFFLLFVCRQFTCAWREIAGWIELQYGHFTPGLPDLKRTLHNLQVLWETCRCLSTRGTSGAGTSDEIAVAGVLYIRHPVRRSTTDDSTWDSPEVSRVRNGWI